MHIHQFVAAAITAVLVVLAIPHNRTLSNGLMSDSLAAVNTAVAGGQDVVLGIPVNPEREAYYGDLHLHTSYSFDTYMGFGAEVDPDGAYRFAR